ncbi:helix-turn-helix domain-containing protein, partial [Acinetobacter colistiniresistens]|uniref:helix-turn-helix domain-containing protein n=1 Tax=Acinetobacter colistiniresistens TaxID=280145 RepID=UPI0013A695AA
MYGDEIYLCNKACIEYWREYRTFFHLGMSYGVSETSAIRITRVIEDTLIRSGKF